MNHPFSVSHVFWDTSPDLRALRKENDVLLCSPGAHSACTLVELALLGCGHVNLAPGGNGPLLHFH